MTNELVSTQTPNFEPIIDLVLNDLNSPLSRVMYAKALTDFLNWYAAAGAPGLTKATVNDFKRHLQANTTYSPATINQKLSAIRKLAAEAADNGLIDQSAAAAIGRVKGSNASGVRSGNWLELDEAQRLLRAPDTKRLKGLRDRAILAVLLGTGLRRTEAAKLEFSHLQQRAGRWAIVDLTGKRGKVRTIPVPSWAKAALDEYTDAANIQDGLVFRSINRGERVGAGMTGQAIHDVVKFYCAELGFKDLATHDLRRTYARLARAGGAELSQLALSLGHSSVKTTELYVNEALDLTKAPCDVLGLRL